MLGGEADLLLLVVLVAVELAADLARGDQLRGGDLLAPAAVAVGAAVVADAQRQPRAGDRAGALHDEEIGGLRRRCSRPTGRRRQRRRARTTRRRGDMQRPSCRSGVTPAPRRRRGAGRRRPSARRSRGRARPPGRRRRTGCARGTARASGRPASSAVSVDPRLGVDRRRPRSAARGASTAARGVEAVVDDADDRLQDRRADPVGARAAERPARPRRRRRARPSAPSSTASAGPAAR